MNIDLFNAVKQIVAKEGEAILSDSRRVSAFLSDLAKDVPKPQKNVLIKCLEHGYAKVLKEAAESERANIKQKLAQRMNDEEALDSKQCIEALDLLTAVLFGEEINLESAETPTATIPRESSRVDAGKPSDKISPAANAGAAPAAPGIESLMKRGWLFLEDSDWKQADEYFDKVLDIDPEYAPAYVGKLCAELRAKREELLGDNKEPISENNHFKKAVRFGSADIQARLKDYDEKIGNRIADGKRQEQERLRQEAERLQQAKRQEEERIENEKRQEAERVRLEQEQLEKRKLVLKDARQRIANYQKCITGGIFTIGLKSDGTVVAVGYNDDGRCKTSSWRDIVAVSASDMNTIGLKADGTVVAVGGNEEGQCNTSSWKDIVAISAGENHIVGLKADGTVVVVGSNDHGQCNTSSWRDIVAIFAGFAHTVGLKADGTVVAVGVNSLGQCDTSSWQDIVAISAEATHTVGLKADGTVVAVGYNPIGQCDTSSWQDIVAISAGSAHTVGLKADGTVVVVGRNDDGQCNTSSWRDIGPVPEELIQKWKQWTSQGLCCHCGGTLGLFKKCKSCGTKN